jgi:hypothetical protein
MPHGLREVYRRFRAAHHLHLQDQSVNEARGLAYHLLLACFIYSSILKMAAEHSSETHMNFHWTTWHYQKDSSLQHFHSPQLQSSNWICSSHRNKQIQVQRIWELPQRYVTREYTYIIWKNAVHTKTQWQEQKKISHVFSICIFIRILDFLYGQTCYCYVSVQELVQTATTVFGHYRGKILIYKLHSNSTECWMRSQYTILLWIYKTPSNYEVSNF